MFRTMGEILRPCVGQGWAVGAYDTCTLETTQAILDAAAADEAPTILMIYPGHTPQADWRTLARLIAAEVERAGVPAALVLDHAKSLDQVEYALTLGFSGIMIDASLAPLEDNIALTRQAVELAHAWDVSVEAELGHVGTGEDVLSEDEQAAHLTRVDEAERFAAETGVDALAVSIGTVHGLYRGTPKLDFERLAQLQAVCPIPLVLHGGSDTPDADLHRAIELGIAKINVWTDVRLPYLRVLREQLDGPVEKVDIHTAFSAARTAAYQVVRQKNRLFGAAGKAGLYA
jgi:fructose-bisphosphate aldolase, class II